MIKSDITSAIEQHYQSHKINRINQHLIIIQKYKTLQINIEIDIAPKQNCTQRIRDIETTKYRK